MFIHVWGEAGSGKTALAVRLSSELSRRGLHIVYISVGLPRGLWSDVERVTFILSLSDEDLAALPETIENILNPRTRMVVDTIASLFRHLPRTVRLRLLPVTLLRLKRLSEKRRLIVLLLNDVSSAEGKVKPWEGEEVRRYVDLEVQLNKDDGRRIVEGESLYCFIPMEVLEEIF